MRFSRSFSVISGALVLVGATTIAYAAAPDDDPVIHACYARADASRQNLVQVLLGNGGHTYTKGDLRFVAEGESCKAHETPLQWDAGNDRVAEELAALADRVAELEEQVADNETEAAERIAALEARVTALEPVAPPEEPPGDAPALYFVSEPRPNDVTSWWAPRMSARSLEPGTIVYLHAEYDGVPGEPERAGMMEESGTGGVRLEGGPLGFPISCSARNAYFEASVSDGTTVRTGVIPKGPGCP